MPFCTFSTFARLLVLLKMFIVITFTLIYIYVSYLYFNCISCQENSSGLIIRSAMPRTVESFNRACKHTENLKTPHYMHVSLLDTILDTIGPSVVRLIIYNFARYLQQMVISFTQNELVLMG